MLKKDVTDFLILLTSDDYINSNKFKHDFMTLKEDYLSKILIHSIYYQLIDICNLNIIATYLKHYIDTESYVSPPMNTLYTFKHFIYLIHCINTYLIHNTLPLPDELSQKNRRSNHCFDPEIIYIYQLCLHILLCKNTRSRTLPNNILTLLKRPHDKKASNEVVTCQNFLNINTIPIEAIHYYPQITNTRIHDIIDKYYFEYFLYRLSNSVNYKMNTRIDIRHIYTLLQLIPNFTFTNFKYILCKTIRYKYEDFKLVCNKIPNEHIPILRPDLQHKLNLIDNFKNSLDYDTNIKIEKHSKLCELFQVYIELFINSDKIGQGSYGKVYYPPLKCKKKNTCPIGKYNECYNGITKLMTIRDARQELFNIHSLGLNTIDKDYNITVRLIHHCEIDQPNYMGVNMDHSKNKYKNNNTNTNTNTNSYYQVENNIPDYKNYALIYEYGGIPLHKYMIILNSIHKNYIKKKGTLLTTPTIINAYLLQRKNILNYIYQLVSKLYILHQHHVYHLDIKPDNVVIDDTRVRLIDYGLSVKIYHNSAPKPNKLYGQIYTFPFELSFLDGSNLTLRQRIKNYKIQSLNPCKNDYGIDEYQHAGKKLLNLQEFISKVNVYTITQNYDYIKWARYIFSKVDLYQIGIILNNELLFGKIYQKYYCKPYNNEKINELECIKTLLHPVPRKRLTIEKLIQLLSRYTP